MDVEPRAKAKLLKQIRDAGGVQPFLIAETYHVMCRYLDEFARARLLDEVERTRQPGWVVGLGPLPLASLMTAVGI